MKALALMYAEFWNESHWLPPGFNWSSLQNTQWETYPQFRDLRLPFFYMFVILAVRFVFERSIARPLGRLFGIVDSAGDSHSILSSIFALIHRLKFKLPVSHEFNGHSAVKSTEKRDVQFGPSTLDKFSECCWRFTFYFFILCYGFTTLRDFGPTLPSLLFTPFSTCCVYFIPLEIGLPCFLIPMKSYFGSTLHCWYGYPLQPMTNDVYWYYMLELSFYWSLLISQFFDVHRKDFWENFIHHIVTILLLSFSWLNNFVRVGSLVLLTHDAADCFLEGTKMARYCKRFKLSNFIFVIFALVWTLTRCVYLPLWILYSTLFETVSLIGYYEAYYVFNFLLLLLQTLHFIWTYMIGKILLNMLESGRMDDVRSDTEENENSDDDTTARKLERKKSN